MNDFALAQLARSWRQVPPGCTQVVLSVGDARWGPILERLSTDPSGPVRVSLATLVGDAGDTRASGIATAMLHDQDAVVGEQAERSLMLLAIATLRERLLNDLGASAFVSKVPAASVALVAGRGLRGGVDELCLHLAEGAMTFGEHRRRGPVIAAILVAGREQTRGIGPGAQALKKWFAAGQHPSHSVLRSVLRWSKAPVARVRAMEWLSRDGLAIACVERLVRGRSLLEHELVLSNAHLMARPRRQARCAGAKVMLPQTKPGMKAAETEESVPSSGALRRLSPAARRGLPAFLAGLGAPSKTRWTAMEPLLSDEDATVRYAASRAAPSAGLTEFCFDQDGRVARGAYLRSSATSLSAPREASLGGRELKLLARSPHADIRTWAQQDGAGRDSVASSVVGRIALRRLMRDDRQRFLDQIRTGLTSRDVAHALQTLAQMRAFGLADELAGPVLDLAADDSRDPRVTATAVSLLAFLQVPRAAELATVRMTHTDGRVRANAVEALGRIRRRDARATLSVRPALMIEAKNDTYHRVRANALRVWFGAEAVDDLAEMLGDSRPMHRLAGMWVAQRLLPGCAVQIGPRWSELAARIAELSRFDEDELVRARAAACARRLELDVRNSWLQGAAS